MRHASRRWSNSASTALVLSAASLLAARPSAAQCMHTDPVNYFTFGLPAPAPDSRMSRATPR
jgi:hypothetical protein